MNSQVCMVDEAMVISPSQERLIPNDYNELQHQNSIEIKEKIERCNGDVFLTKNDIVLTNAVIPHVSTPKQYLDDTKREQSDFNANGIDNTEVDIYKERISLALYAYFHHKYHMFAPSGCTSMSPTTYSLAEDIRQASCIPNRLQESFTDRLGFLFDEHGYLITQDALLRPADAKDEEWQKMVQKRIHSEEITDIARLSEDVEEIFEVALTDEEARNNDEDDDKEDDEKSIKATLAQGAGAYVFTKFVPLALGLSMSVPMVLITACVGVVAGQVAWDSYQQQQLLYPPRYYSSHSNKNIRPGTSQCSNNNTQTASEEQLFSLVLSQATSSSNCNNHHQTPLSLDPPKRLSLLRHWWKDMYVALAHSSVGISLEENAVKLFTSHWLQSFSTQRSSERDKSGHDNNNEFSQSSTNLSNDEVTNEPDDEWELVETLK